MNSTVSLFLYVTRNAQLNKCETRFVLYLFTFPRSIRQRWCIIGRLRSGWSFIGWAWHCSQLFIAFDYFSSHQITSVHGLISSRSSDFGRILEYSLSYSSSTRVTNYSVRAALLFSTIVLRHQPRLGIKALARPKPRRWRASPAACLTVDG